MKRRVANAGVLGARRLKPGRPARRVAQWVAIAILAWTPIAHAQASGDAAAAQDFFDRARKLVKQGNYAEACPKFAESQRLDPQPGTEFNLADCYEHVGKTASAWVAFADVADRLRVEGDKARGKVAQARTAALEPKLVRLAINAPAEARVNGLTIKRDGEAVRDAQWGVGVPVDPGPHAIEASAPGMRTWTKTVDVKGPGETATVDVPKLEPEATPAAPAPGAAPVPAVETAPVSPSPAAPEARGGTQRTLGIITGGVGIVALGLGTYFGAETISKNNASHGDCNGNLCDQQGYDNRKDALSAGNASTIAFGVGIAALAAGVVLYVTAPRDSTETPATSGPSARRSPRLQWSAGITPGGVLIDGSF